MNMHVVLCDFYFVYACIFFERAIFVPLNIFYTIVGAFMLPLPTESVMVAQQPIGVVCP